jgi:hypothetical protein
LLEILTCALYEGLVCFVCLFVFIINTRNKEIQHRIKPSKARIWEILKDKIYFSHIVIAEEMVKGDMYFRDLKYIIK